MLTNEKYEGQLAAGFSLDDLVLLNSLCNSPIKPEIAFLEHLFPDKIQKKQYVLLLNASSGVLEHGFFTNQNHDALAIDSEELGADKTQKGLYDANLKTLQPSKRQKMSLK